MTRLPPNVEDMINSVTGTSRTELNLIRSLSDAIRRADEQVLRELRAVSLQHDIRRESILEELQGLATRLCSLPVRSVTRHTIEQQPMPAPHAVEDSSYANGHGADWRQAAQNIQDDLDFTFGEPPRH